MRLVIGLMLALFASPAMAQLVTTPTEVTRGAVNNFIRPAMRDFSAAAGGLSDGMAQLCEAPSQQALDSARSAFGDAAVRHARIEALRIGPLMEENRADRLLFWPDRKGIALKQVQAILADEDPSATAVETLKGKSVAVQGLTALEFVLYGTGYESLMSAEGSFRCAYGLAIAQNVADIAGALNAGWQDPDGFALHLMRPQPDFADYRTPIEAQEELVGILAHGVEAIRDTRLNPFLSKDGAPAKPKLALFWRSGLTLASASAGIAGLQSLFDLSGIAGGVPKESAPLIQAIEAGFAQAQASLSLVQDPLETALADPQQAAALADVVVATQSLGMLIGEQMSAALGLSVGFSSLDGD